MNILHYMSFNDFSFISDVGILEFDMFDCRFFRNIFPIDFNLNISEVFFLFWDRLMFLSGNFFNGFYWILK